MIGIDQLDFINYTALLKGNYRKGVHAMQAIMGVSEHTLAFAKNKGAVAVVLGTPPWQPDKNSEALINLLLTSWVAETAVETFFSMFWPGLSMDDILRDPATCRYVWADPRVFRAASASKVVMGKLIATLVGLDCRQYADINAFVQDGAAMALAAQSSDAMTLLTGVELARAALVNSAPAMQAIVASELALDRVFADARMLELVWASQTAMAAFAGNLTVLRRIKQNPALLPALAANNAAMSALMASPHCTRYAPGAGAFTSETFNFSGICIGISNGGVNSNIQCRIDNDASTGINITTTWVNVMRVVNSTLLVLWTPSGLPIMGFIILSAEKENERMKINDMKALDYTFTGDALTVLFEGVTLEDITQTDAGVLTVRTDDGSLVEVVAGYALHSVTFDLETGTFEAAFARVLADEAKNALTGIALQVDALEQAVAEGVTPEGFDGVLRFSRILFSQAADTLTNEQVILCATLAAEWTAGRYDVGAVRSLDGQMWRCCQAHDNENNPDIRPGTAAGAAFWVPYHGESVASARPFVQPVGAHDTYKPGEHMLYTDGVIYKALQETNYSPEAYPAAWEAVNVDG